MSESPGVQPALATSRLRDVVERHLSPWIASTLHVLRPAASEPTDHVVLERLLSSVEERIRQAW